MPSFKTCLDKQLRQQVLQAGAFLVVVLRASAFAAPAYQILCEDSLSGVAHVASHSAPQSAMNAPAKDMTPYPGRYTNEKVVRIGRICTISLTIVIVINPFSLL
jgi:hypothetical protein